MRHLFLFLLLCLERADRQLHVASGHYNFSPAPTHGVYPAYILAPSRQLLTSSTLKWVDIHNIQSGRIKGDKVVTSGKTAVCRKKFGNRLEPGRTDLSGNCVVMGEKEKDYQVLVDMYSMSRFGWNKWSMFNSPAVGSVAFNEKTFIGLMEAEEGKIISELDYARGLSGEFVWQMSEDAVKTETSGWALVETEPIRYSLEDLVFQTEKVVSSEKVTLGTVYLERENNESGESDWREVSERFEASWAGHEYWGSVAGAVRGLPFTVQTSRGLAHTHMGLVTSPEQNLVRRIIRRLQPGTRLTVTVTGIRQRLDTVYTCALHSVYTDGSLGVHNITSVMTRDEMVNITESAARPVYLDTGLPAPFTTTTTTSPPPTTAPSIATTTAQPQAERLLNTGPTSTLFPPPPAPVTRANPLKKFYPDSGDSDDGDSQHLDIVRVDILPLSHATSARTSGLVIMCVIFLTNELL